MASVRNAPSHKRGDKSGLPSIREDHESIKKNRRELRAIRVLGLTAILLGIIALVLLGFKLFEGQEAADNANALLEAYKAQNTVQPSVSPAAEPSASATAETSTEPIGTPEPTDENFEQTDENADATAATDANQHLANDGSVTTTTESGEYVQPDAPEEVSNLDKVIQKIIKATGDDGMIGILEIPEINQELPIIGKWSYNLLKISICRYKGPDPNEDGNLVLIGHNYKSGAHFGDLDKLSVGSELFLTNTRTGERVRYEVYQIKHIAPDAFSALKSFHGPAGLTLMTCRNNGTNRLLIRCEQKEAEPTPTVTPVITPRVTPTKAP
ncbi:MAG TPA: sortase [Clostridia bacterium]|nr:sortase [Clostridia bacterium]